MTGAFSLGITVSCLLAGCGGQGNANPYAEEMRSAMDQTSSQYVKDVLQRGLDNGAITREDYDDCHTKYVECLRDNGITANLDADDLGFWSVSVLSSTENKEADLKCHQEWVGEISHLYEAQSTNPEKADPDRLIAECYVRKGVAPEGFSAADLREYRANNRASCQNGVCTYKGVEYKADEVPVMEPERIPGAPKHNPELMDACDRAPLR